MCILKEDNTKSLSVVSKQKDTSSPAGGAINTTVMPWCLTRFFNVILML